MNKKDLLNKYKTMQCAKDYLAYTTKNFFDELLNNDITCDDFIKSLDENELKYIYN